MKGEQVAASEEACPLFTTQALQDLGAGCLRCRRRVGRRGSVVGHGGVVVRGVDAGGIIRGAGSGSVLKSCRPDVGICMS